MELYREKGFKAVQTALQHSNAATTEIYSFADWSTGTNADEPLRRRDLQLIIKMVIEALGEAYKLPQEGKKRKKAGSDRPTPEAAESARFTRIMRGAERTTAGKEGNEQKKSLIWGPFLLF